MGKFEKCTVAMLGGPCSQHVMGNTSRLNQPQSAIIYWQSHCLVHIMHRFATVTSWSSALFISYRICITYLQNHIGQVGCVLLVVGSLTYCLHLFVSHSMKYRVTFDSDVNCVRVIFPSTTMGPLGWLSFVLVYGTYCTTESIIVLKWDLLHSGRT